MISFEKFNEKKMPARKYFFSSTRKGKTDSDGKILDSHLSVKDYLTCEYQTLTCTYLLIKD